MICTQIMAEYAKQTNLYEKILQKLTEINTKLDNQSIVNDAQPQANASGRLLSVKETAQFLGISKSTIYNWMSRYSKNTFPIKPKRVGRRVMFDRVELEAYISSLSSVE